MEKLNIFFLIIIVCFLIYSYLKANKKIKKNLNVDTIETNKDIVRQEIAVPDYERHIITAVLAAVMDGKKYKIRNIFLEKETGKKTVTSTWKISGRQYTMQRRDRL